MKKNFLKIVTIAVLFAVITSVMTACNNQGESSNPDLSSQISESTSEVPSQPAEEVRDFENAEFVIGSHWARAIFPEVGESEYGDKILARYSEIEEKYNCRITYKEGTPEEFVNGVSTSIAAGLKYADVIESNLWWYNSFLTAGYLEPLDDIEDMKIEDEMWLSLAKTATEFRGKTYGFDWTTWYYRIPHIYYILYFNKNILEQKNQPDPYELFEQGQWNWETFREILKNTTDPANEIDGLVGLDRHFEMSAIRSNGAREVNISQDGIYTFGLQDERAYEALEYVRDIINIDKSYGDYYDGRSAGVDWTIPISKFRDGNAAFMIYHTHVLEFKGFLDAMPDDYGVIPFPRGPKGESDYNSAITGDTRVFSIPVTTDDKDMAGFIMRQIAQPLAGSSADDWKNSAKRIYFRDDKGFDHYLKSVEFADRDYFEAYGVINFGETINALLSVTRDQSASPAQAMGRIRSAMQQELEDAFNN